LCVPMQEALSYLLIPHIVIDWTLEQACHKIEVGCS
jgi:hypothetical protein